MAQVRYDPITGAEIDAPPAGWGESLTKGEHAHRDDLVEVTVVVRDEGDGDISEAEIEMTVGELAERFAALVSRLARQQYQWENFEDSDLLHDAAHDMWSELYRWSVWPSD